MKQADRDIQSLLTKAAALHRQGDMDGAEILYREVLELNPEEHNALHLLGVVAWQRGDTSLAEESVRKAINLDGTNASYYCNLGGILRQKNDFVDAIHQYETALSLEPSYEAARKELSQTLHRYGLALTKEQKWEEVKALYRRVLELEPNNIATLNNLAAIVQHQNNRTQALSYYNRALAVEPDNLLVRYNRSICYLTEKRLHEGWIDFTASIPHWYNAQDKRAHLPWMKRPLWKGENLRGKSFLLWGDNGIGDEVLYASMVPDLIARGALVTIECNPRLVPLFARSFPGVTALPRESTPLPRGDYDYHAPGMWLSSQLHPNMLSFAMRPSFLKADDGKKAILRERYRAFGKKRIIGLSWFTASPAWGLARSIPLPDMLAPLPLKDTLIINMQYGLAQEAWEEARRTFPDLTVFHDPEIDQLEDMDSFAAQVAACDAIYTISNTTSHIAGALGIPAAILMSDIGLTWYWFSHGDKSPWYPSLHLLRPHIPNRLEMAASLAVKLADGQAA